MNAVRGRILYDFTGNECEGYALQFRQVSEVDMGEGKVAMSDLRATTWEEAAAKSFRFNSQSFLNDTLTDAVDGNVAVTCTPPSGSEFPVGTTTVDCTAHDAHSNVANGS